MDKNYTVKQTATGYRVFINLGNGMSFLLHGSYDTPEAAEAAYARWQADESEKREHRAQVQPFEGTWG